MNRYEQASNQAITRLDKKQMKQETLAKNFEKRWSAYNYFEKPIASTSATTPKTDSKFVLIFLVIFKKKFEFHKISSNYSCSPLISACIP